jgi:hypothetical protein
MLTVHGRKYRWEQLLRTPNQELGHVLIMNIQIKPDTERLLKQKQCQIPYWRLILLKNITGKYVNLSATVICLHF